MKYTIPVVALSLLLIAGCQMQSSDIYSFFGQTKVLDYVVNCTYGTNISLSNTNCPVPKRAIFVNYNTTWSEVCCSFDSRCLEISNANLSDGCNNMSATYSYMGPAISSESVATGSVCCNGLGECYVDTLASSNCTNSNYAMATLSFNLTNTSEWNAICCKD